MEKKKKLLNKYNLEDYFLPEKKLNISQSRLFPYKTASVDFTTASNRKKLLLTNEKIITLWMFGRKYNHN